jgi:regulator of protease activity HflC (stomatin/prohibitin superfamily)
MIRTLGIAGVGLAASLLCGCESTSSTEVGVRTSMVGLIEERGHQQIYAPGGVYLVAPVVNTWNVLPISQQNLLMNNTAEQGDRPVPDDITFKTRDGNNVHIDVNVMWRIDPQKAGYVISHVGQSIGEIKERLVRTISRSVIRDVFNEITSEEYYQVAVKNRMAEKAKTQLATELESYGLIVDMLQVQQHRFDPEYQAAINAQKQAEADVQMLAEQQKNMGVQKQSELQAKQSEWNKMVEDSMGAAGQTRNQADGYYQTKTNEAKALLASARAEAESTKKEAEAFAKMGGDAYVKMQLARQLGKKRFLIVPASNVSTMNVNQLVDYLLGNSQSAPAAK